MNKRDRDICNKLALGFSFWQIATFYGSTLKTIEHRVAALRKRYQSNNTTHLIATLLRSGEIT